jgi:hypothetical protein
MVGKMMRAWVGAEIDTRHSYTPGPLVYLQAEFYYYIDLEWHQRRELIFVAVADDALDYLFAYTQLGKSPTTTANEILTIPRNATPINPDVLMRFIYASRQKTADRNFRAAVSRTLQRIVRHSEFRDELEELPVATDAATCVGYVDSMCQKLGPAIYAIPGQPMRVWPNTIPDQAPVTSFNFLNSISTAENLVLVVGDSDDRDWEGVRNDKVTPSLGLFAFGNPYTQITRNHLIDALKLAKGPRFRTYQTVLRGRYYDDMSGKTDNQVGSQQVLAGDMPREKNLRIRAESTAGIDQWISELSSPR